MLSVTFIQQNKSTGSMTLGIMTLGIMTLGIMTLGIMTVSIKDLFATKPNLTYTENNKI